MRHAGILFALALPFGLVFFQQDDASASGATCAVRNGSVSCTVVSHTHDASGPGGFQADLSISGSLGASNVITISHGTDPNRVLNYTIGTVPCTSGADCNGDGQDDIGCDTDELPGSGEGSCVDSDGPLGSVWCLKADNIYFEECS